MDGPPEIVEGIVMNVMTSCSLRPARRARKPPMAWMPSCEFPAMRITASGTVEIFGVEPEVELIADSLIFWFRLGRLSLCDRMLSDKQPRLGDATAPLYHPCSFGQGARVCGIPG